MKNTILITCCFVSLFNFVYPMQTKRIPINSTPHQMVIFSHTLNAMEEINIKSEKATPNVAKLNSPTQCNVVITKAAYDIKRKFFLLSIVLVHPLYAMEQ
jgi:hypothetical protein